MNEPRIGIDRRGRQVVTATTRHDSGRITIDQLQRFDPGSPEESPWADAGAVALAVPDQLATVKLVWLEAGGETTREDRNRFELARSLLEDETDFVFASQSTGNDLRPLGLAFRRETVARLGLSCGCDPNALGDRLSLQARSIGLGRGYLAFCRQAEGELTCLVDLTASAASICFVRGTDIVEVASLATSEQDLASAHGREQFGVDLKTVVNFKQAALMEVGIGVPLSSLLLAGDGVDDGFREAVQTYFPVGVGRPRLHDGFIGGIEGETDESLSRYLVALGATVY